MQHDLVNARMLPYFPFSELYWALFHVLSNPLGCWSQHIISTWNEILHNRSRLQVIPNLSAQDIPTAQNRNISRTYIRFLPLDMILVVWASDPLGRLRICYYRVMIPPPRRCAGQMILGAAAGRIALLDVFDSAGSERVWEDILGDAALRFRNQYCQQRGYLKS